MPERHHGLLDDLFGRNTWEDVQRSLTAYTYRRWPGIRDVDREDAVSAAILDLVDYWVFLDSSRGGDSERRFAYAMTRGRFTINAHLGWVVDELERLEPNSVETFTQYMGQASQAGDPTGRPLNLSRYAEALTSDPRADAEEAEREEQVRQRVNSIPVEEWDTWLMDYLQGTPIAEVAAAEGVSKQAIAQRRARGMARLRKHLQKVDEQ